MRSKTITTYQRRLLTTKMVFAGACIAAGIGLCIFDRVGAALAVFGCGIMLCGIALLGCRYTGEMDQTIFSWLVRRDKSSRD